MADVVDFEKALQRKKQKIKQSLTDTTDLLDRSFTDDELVDVAQFDKNIEKVFNKIEDVAANVTPFTESRVEACLDELFFELFAGIEERDFDNSEATDKLLTKLDDIVKNK